MIKISTLFQGRPQHYGLVYLSLIPIYAALYYLFPSIIGSERSYIECLYFSTVTITTLGYGDITPVDEIGQIVTASESLLGVVSIGLFLNAIGGARSDTVRKEQSEKAAKIYRESQQARLNGHYCLIGPIIGKFERTVIEISHPTRDISNGYNPNFVLNDMKNLYKPTALLSDPLLRPAICGYFESIEELRREISDLIKNVDLRCFPSIENLCLTLVNVITNFDRSGYILSATETFVGDKRLSDLVMEKLDNYSGNHLPQGSHILDGYVTLYHQIKTVMQLLSQLEADITTEIQMDP